MEARQPSRCLVITGCDDTHRYRYFATVRLISQEEHHGGELPTEAGDNPDAAADLAPDTAEGIVRKFIGVRRGKRSKNWVRRYIKKVRTFCKVGNHAKRITAMRRRDAEFSATQRVNDHTEKDTGIVYDFCNRPYVDEIIQLAPWNYYPTNDADMSD